MCCSFPPRLRPIPTIAEEGIVLRPGVAIDVLWNDNWWEAEIRLNDQGESAVYYTIGREWGDPGHLDNPSNYRSGHAWDPSLGEKGEWKGRVGWPHDTGAVARPPAGQKPAAQAAKAPKAAPKRPASTTANDAAGKKRRAAINYGNDDDDEEEDEVVIVEAKQTKRSVKQAARKSIATATAKSGRGTPVPVQMQDEDEDAAHGMGVQLEVPLHDSTMPLLTPELLRALFMDRRRFTNLWSGKCASDAVEACKLLPGCIVRVVDEFFIDNAKSPLRCEGSPSHLFIIDDATATAQYGTIENVLRKTLISGRGFIRSTSSSIHSVPLQSLSSHPPTNAQLVAFIEGELQCKRLSMNRVRETLERLKVMEGPGNLAAGVALNELQGKTHIPLLEQLRNDGDALAWAPPSENGGPAPLALLPSAQQQNRGSPPQTKKERDSGAGAQQQQVAGGRQNGGGGSPVERKVPPKPHLPKAVCGSAAKNCESVKAGVTVTSSMLYYYLPDLPAEQIWMGPFCYKCLCKTKWRTEYFTEKMLVSAWGQGDFPMPLRQLDEAMKQQATRRLSSR